jgi:A/G-specific adenine glycosylase
VSPKSFSESLLTWYLPDSRGMPWRGANDAYQVWVSEIMLQQTRVDTVRSFYLRWMRQFPDVKSLAEASEQDVLKAWEGLGYYARARNLLKAARLIMEQYDGVFPSNLHGISSLPGIGAYTAAAIASIAFGLDEPAIDGNVRRVLVRVQNIRAPLGSPKAEDKFQTAARNLLAPGRAGDFNQAMMDLGSSICIPRQPRCSECPVHQFCAAYKAGTQAELPVKLPKPMVPTIQVIAAVIHKDAQVLIARRPSSGLLGGMWEFPGGKVEPGETDEEALKREIIEELGAKVQVGACLGDYKHAYTHFHVVLRAYDCELPHDEPQPLEASEIRWVEIKTLESFPMGKLDRMISRALAQGET